MFYATLIRCLVSESGASVMHNKCSYSCTSISLLERFNTCTCTIIVRCDDELFVNHVLLLLLSKKLYYCRQKSYLPSIRVLDSKIKMIYQLETTIAKSNNQMSAHNIKWSKYKVQWCAIQYRCCTYERKIVYTVKKMIKRCMCMCV